MAMFERKTKPGESAGPATASTVEERIAHARTAVDLARQEHSAAALADADGAPDGAARLAKSRAALQDASNALADAQAASDGAAARDAAKAQKTAEAESGRRWKRAEEIAKQRAAVAVKVEAAITELAAQFQELKSLGKELHAVAPIPDAADLGTSLVGPLVTNQILQVQLRRAGFGWAATYIASSMVEDQPTLVMRVADGNATVLSNRPK